MIGTLLIFHAVSKAVRAPAETGGEGGSGRGGTRTGEGGTGEGGTRTGEGGTGEGGSRTGEGGTGEGGRTGEGGTGEGGRTGEGGAGEGGRTGEGGTGEARPGERTGEEGGRTGEGGETPRVPEYDPRSATTEQLRQDMDPTPRAGETAEQAAARARAAAEELRARSASLIQALLARIAALQSRLARVRAQAAEVPENIKTQDGTVNTPGDPSGTSVRPGLLERADALQEQLQRLQRDAEADPTLEDVQQILDPDVARLEAEVNRLQGDVNRAWVPAPTAAETPLINEYTAALNQLRNALHDLHAEGVDPAARASAPGRAADARAVMDRIEQQALEQQNAEGSALSRLYDNLQSLIEQRDLMERRAGTGEFNYPMEEPPGSGNYVEGIGRQIECAAARVASLAGRTYAQIRALIGSEPRRSGAVWDPAAGEVTGAVRLSWRFADGSEIHIDIPGPDNSSPFGISRQVHAGRTGPTPHNSLHLSDNGVGVPSHSAPAHIPVVSDAALRSKLMQPND
jgi:hypothetical protein